MIIFAICFLIIFGLCAIGWVWYEYLTVGRHVSYYDSFYELVNDYNNHILKDAEKTIEQFDNDRWNECAKDIRRG